MATRSVKDSGWNYNGEITLPKCKHDIPKYTVSIKLSTSDGKNIKVTATFNAVDENWMAENGGYFAYNIGIRYGYSESDLNNLEKYNTDGIWSWSNSGEYGNGDYGDKVVNIEFNINLNSKNQTFYIEPVCTGCGSHDGVTYVPFDEGDAETYLFKVFLNHQHIDPPTPTIKKTSGTTITVSCNSSDDKQGYVREVNTSNWYNSEFTFSNYQKNSSHTFEARRKCSCGDYINSEKTVTGKTWNISLNTGTQTTKTLSFKATHTSGTGGDSSNTKIVYELYSDSSYRIKIKSIIDSNGETITFTGLTPGTTYYCKAYSNGIKDKSGNFDNVDKISLKTKDKFKIESNDQKCDCSATTIKVSPKVSASNGSTGIKCTIKLSETNKSLTPEIGKSKAFTGLTPGTAYSITFTFVDSENNTETITKVCTTKKAYIELGDEPNITTKNIKIKCYAEQAGSSKMETKLSTSSTWETVTQNTNKIFSSLDHYTTYTIQARIVDCYAYNANDGSITSTNDSTVSKDIKTLKLSISLSSLECHQHSITISTTAFAGSTPCDSDKIDSYKYQFSIDNCLAKAVRTEGYCNNCISNDKITKDGTVNGNYSNNKKIYFNDLTYYYCKYQLIVAITDGHNIVTNSIFAFTTFPYIRIYLNGEWHRVMPYVYRNNEWKLAPIFVNTGTSFAECDGEK